MSHMYWYKKNFIVHPEPLIDMIKLSSIKEKFESLKVCYNQETSTMDIIEVYMKEVLVSEDEDVLVEIINEYSPSCEMQVRYDLESSLINPAMSYGREIIAKMGTNNVYKQKSDAQIQAISASTKDLVDDLLTGSLKQAYFKCLVMQPDENISQEEIDEFTKRVGWFLGL